MDIPELPSQVLKGLAVAVVAIATVTDLRTRKIPNKLTFPAALAGIILQAVYFASWGTPADMALRACAGATNGIAGWFTGVFIMGVTKVFLAKMGHGDTKLMAAVGAILGPGYVVVAYFYYGLAFGIPSIFRMAASVPWNELWFYLEARKAGVEAKRPDLSRFQEVRKGDLAVAPYIALGTILAVLFYDQTIEAALGPPQE